MSHFKTYAPLTNLNNYILTYRHGFTLKDETKNKKAEKQHNELLFFSLL